MRKQAVSALVVSLFVAGACSSADNQSASSSTAQSPVPSTSSSTTSTSSTSTTSTTAAPLLAETFVPASTDSLLPVEDCKIPDVTPSTPTGIFNNSSGFPIPDGAVTQTGEVKLWVIPVETSDFQASEQGLADLEASLEKVADFFDEQSYGRASLRYSIEAESNWVRFPGTASEYGFGESKYQQDFSPVMQEILENWIPSGPVSENDLVMAVLPPVPGVVVAMSTRRFDLKRFNNVLLQNGVLISSGGNEIRTWELQAHELGHSWMRLEDLYHGRGDVPYQDYMGSWDIMADAASKDPNFSSWSRWRSGWIDDAEVLCVTPTIASKHFVGLVENSSARPKALVIPTSSNSTIIVEVRGGGSGAPVPLAYTVDTSIEHQLGPYRVQSAIVASQTAVIGDVTLTLVDRDSSGVVIEVGPTP